MSGTVPAGGRRIAAAALVGLSAIGPLAMHGAGGVLLGAVARPIPLQAQATVNPGDSAAIALLDRVAGAYRGARTLRARFTQTLTPASGGAAMTSSGEFLQTGSARFAFRFSDPAGDRIVADGSVVWIYLPSTLRDQAIRLPRGVGAGAGLDLVAALLTEPARRYIIRGLPDTVVAGRRAMQLTMEPKGGAGAPFTRATLRIDASRRVIVGATLREPSGLVRTLAFTAVRLGGRLPSDAFSFTPPAGVRVIDQAALLGGMTPR